MPTAPPPHPLTELEPDGWPEDAAPDALIGDWRLWQRRGGHRTSTDDLLTAWMGVRAVGFDHVGFAAGGRYLDIGCGVGSVMLMVAHRLRPATTIGIEAQRQSVAMARRSVAELPGAPPIEVRHQDLRAADPADLGLFDLITGSPPYLPVGTAVPSADAQRRACRLELRGGVEGYCEAAARLLAPGGRFALVFQSVWTPRVLAAGRAAGLRWVDQVDVTMREGTPTPFLSVYTFALAGADGAVAASPGLATGTIETMAIRDSEGGWTEAYRRLRAELGLSDAERARR